MIRIKEKNNISIIFVILLFLLVISTIWVCFILGEIEHDSKSKDSVDVFYKEKDNKDKEISDGEIIIFEKKEENTIVQPIIEEENNINNVSKRNFSKTNNTYKKNQVIDNKIEKENITTNETKGETQNPEKQPDREYIREPENSSKLEEPNIPNKPEDPKPPIPEKPDKPNEPENPEEPDPPKPPEIDRTGTYWVEDKDIVWQNKCKLGIFKNPKYNMRNLIAPGSTSSYVFYVSNKMGFDLNYIINFSEENDINVNMMYKLRREDEYIAGDENTWVYYDNLHIDYEIANEGKDKYILEWKWVDSDNDTEIGINHAGEIYKLNIDIYATQISGFEEETPAENNPNEEDNTGDNSGNTGNNSDNAGDNSDNTGENSSNTEDNSSNTGENSSNT